MGELSTGVSPALVRDEQRATRVIATTDAQLFGGVGFVVGTRDQRAGHQADSQTVVGASVGSVIGDVNVVATRG